MIERLLQDHARIREHIARLRALAVRPSVPEIEALAACRWALARDVMQNLMREERHVYVPLARDRRPAAVATAARFHAWLEPGFANFRDHMDQWPAPAVSARWDEYRSCVLSLLALLERRMTEEELELFPLLEQPSHTSGGLAEIKYNWAANGWGFRARIEAH